MVTDNQVRKLMKLAQKEETKSVAAAKAGMDEKTARKYLKAGQLPSQLKKEHTWRTREDPFEKEWGEVEKQLGLNSGFEAKTLFEELQRKHPGKYSDGQLRTFQRKVKRWRCLNGSGKEIYFTQRHQPGELCQSDFTHMGKLGITIQGERFDHLIYHLVLPYSNWESGTICFSESYESLSEGFQNAIWELGGVPRKHQTDSLSAAVRKPNNQEEFTDRYSALLRHYKIKGQKTNPSKPNENGSIEQRHNRFKKALEQSLLLRGGRDFQSRKEYADYLRKLFEQLNKGRRRRFLEEINQLRLLPKARLESVKPMRLRVGKSSTIRVNHNVYSVNSRLIGEQVNVRLYVDKLEIWYAQKKVEEIPRLRGVEKHRIDYRHIISWLVRKPGAFTNYIYREDMFPSHMFRMAFDMLDKKHPAKANKEYLKMLYLAARESQTKVESIIAHLLEKGKDITVKNVEELLEINEEILRTKDVEIDAIDLVQYDNQLLTDLSTGDNGGLYAQ